MPAPDFPQAWMTDETNRSNPINLRLDAAVAGADADANVDANADANANANADAIAGREPDPGAGLRREIKRVIIDACELTLTPESIEDDALLVGTDSSIILDSLDALQAAVAISRHFGVRIRDGNHARRVMRSVATLADFIAEHQRSLA